MNIKYKLLALVLAVSLLEIAGLETLSANYAYQQQQQNSYAPIVPPVYSNTTWVNGIIYTYYYAEPVQKGGEMFAAYDGINQDIFIFFVSYNNNTLFNNNILTFDVWYNQYLNFNYTPGMSITIGNYTFQYLFVDNSGSLYWQMHPVIINGVNVGDIPPWVAPPGSQAAINSSGWVCGDTCG